MKNERIVSWLRDKAARAGEPAHQRMLALAADKILALEKELREAREQSRWIPVTERLPAEYISVLVCIPSEHPLPVVKEAYLANGFWATKTAILHENEISYWRPMPEPPKED